MFPSSDDTQLRTLREDNVRIEPEWYCPILPMVLVNGSEGIGTGYSTFMPNYDVRDVLANIKRLMNDMEPVEMVSWVWSCGGVVRVVHHMRMLLGVHECGQRF